MFAPPCASAADDDPIARPGDSEAKPEPTHLIVSNPLRTPRAPNAVRFVTISDTHNKHASVQLPEGDVLLHAGDFSGVGAPNEVASFAQWFAAQPHANKIVIAGNHDLTFDVAHYAELGKRFRHPKGIDCEGE